MVEYENEGEGGGNTRTETRFAEVALVYLGHRITRDGVATDPGKIDAVRKWAVPRTVQEVQRFLGLVGYYRKFVSNFAATAKPLYRLTERGREFIWTTECEAAFLKLKSRLVSACTYSGISRFYQNVHS